MRKPGRNAPCPCGSGKKYKHCCLATQRRWQPYRDCFLSALVATLDWLLEEHKNAMEIATGRELAELVAPSQFDDFEDLPDSFHELLSINLSEWLVTEGEIEVQGEWRPMAELLFEPGGPPLDEEQKSLLKRWLSRPLGLYEVEEVRPDQTLRLRDLLEREEPAHFQVFEPGLAPELAPGTLFAGRVLPGEPALLSITHYPFDRIEALNLREKLLDELEDCEDPELEREIRSTVTLDFWIETTLAKAPELVDLASGEPLLLTTDHYQVRDWKRLAAVLEAQPDVDGDRKHGWVRLEEPEKDFTRVLLSINLGKKDRVELFARSQTLAEEGRRWFQEVAGDTVRYLTREMTDPASLWQERGTTRGRPPAPEPRDLPPEVRTQLMQQMFERIYRNWADEPLPIFGNKTPRQHLRTRRGRSSVIELLRDYESGERERAEEENRQPASFEFLWRELGLRRGEFLE